MKHQVPPARRDESVICKKFDIITPTCSCLRANHWNMITDVRSGKPLCTRRTQLNVNVCLFYFIFCKVLSLLWTGFWNTWVIQVRALSIISVRSLLLFHTTKGYVLLQLFIKQMTKIYFNRPEYLDWKWSSEWLEFWEGLLQTLQSVLRRTVADTPKWKSILLSISVGSSSCHKRNRIQSLCKLLDG